MRFFKAMAINMLTKRLTLNLFNLFKYFDQEVSTAFEDMLIRNKKIQSITLRLTMQTAVVTQLDFCSILQYKLPLMMTVTNRGSIHNVDRREIYHYLPLNTAGRARLLDITLTMRQFVNMISEFSNNESVSLELLRMVPHSWAY